jgi:hypothetical protein
MPTQALSRHISVPKVRHSFHTNSFFFKKTTCWSGWTVVVLGGACPSGAGVPRRRAQWQAQRASYQRRTRELRRKKKEKKEKEKEKKKE